MESNDTVGGLYLWGWSAGDESGEGAIDTVHGFVAFSVYDWTGHDTTLLSFIHDSKKYTRRFTRKFKRRGLITKARQFARDVVEGKIAQP